MRLDLAKQYTETAAQALTTARAWETVAARAAGDQELAQALAMLDTADVDGPLDAAALELGRREAFAEFERNSALARLQERRAQAGLGLEARCTCEHSAPRHARRLVEGRLPCWVHGCCCKDLTLVPPAG